MKRYILFHHDSCRVFCQSFNGVGGVGDFYIFEKFYIKKSKTIFNKDNFLFRSLMIKNKRIITTSSLWFFSNTVNIDMYHFIMIRIEHFDIWNFWLKIKITSIYILIFEIFNLLIKNNKILIAFWREKYLTISWEGRLVFFI